MTSLVCDSSGVTNSTNKTDLTTIDPRPSLRQTFDVVAALMDTMPSDSMSNSTACPDFSIKELCEHLIMVARRIIVVGNGEHWSSVEQQRQDGGWAETFTAYGPAIDNAWKDDAKLQQNFEVPWGEMVGHPLIATYTAEVAVHGWDLAQQAPRS